MKRIIQLLTTGRTRPTPEVGYVRPVFDRHERENEIELTVYLPGVKDELVEVTLENRDLVVTAPRERPVRANFSAAHLEKSLRDYRLRARLGAGIVLQKLRVEFVDGILRIFVPTEQHARSWQVAVV